MMNEPKSSWLIGGEDVFDDARATRPAWFGGAPGPGWPVALDDDEDEEDEDYLVDEEDEAGEGDEVEDDDEFDDDDEDEDDDLDDDDL